MCERMTVSHPDDTFARDTSWARKVKCLTISMFPFRSYEKYACKSNAELENKCIIHIIYSFILYIHI